MSNIRENNTDDHGAFVILQGERNQNLQFWIIAILALEPEDLNLKVWYFSKHNKIDLGHTSYLLLLQEDKLKYNIKYKVSSLHCLVVVISTV